MWCAVEMPISLREAGWLEGGWLGGCGCVVVSVLRRVMGRCLVGFECCFLGVAQSPWFFPLITTLCGFGLSLVGNKATDGFRLEQPAGFDKGLGGDFVRAANVDGGVAVASINFHGHCGAWV